MGIDQIAVMGHRIGLVPVMHDKRLSVGQDGASGGGIADMPHGRHPMQLLEMGVPEDIGDQPHPLVGSDGLVANHGDAGALLPPMLKCIQPEIAQFCRFGMVMNAKQST